jgi:hypothetical protein
MDVIQLWKSEYSYLCYEIKFRGKPFALREFRGERVKLSVTFRAHLPRYKTEARSVKLVSMTYQLWYNIFLSQQNSLSRLISRRNH